MSSLQNGCPEYQQLSRRAFMGGATMTTVGAVLGLPWLPQVAYANGGPNRDVIVSIFLRGGLDGLGMCVPFGDNAYYAPDFRPTLAIPRPDSNQGGRAIDLDGYFGVAPQMSSLIPAYQAGHLLLATSVGTPNMRWSRSHFDAEHWLETSRGQQLIPRNGWLGRHLATVAPMNPSAPLRALGIMHGLPRTLGGGVRTLPIPDLDNFGFDASFGSQTQSELAEYVSASYDAVQDETKVAVQVARNTITMLDAINFSGYQPAGGAAYSGGDWFHQGLRASAALMRANTGVEAIHLELGGFDTHAEQSMSLPNLLTRLSTGLAAFHRDLTSANVLNWTLVVVSEFGRNARENQSRGTDHGTANTFIALGPNVRGGRVFRTSWPGLARHALVDGIDLRATLDYRDILFEMLAKRGRNPNALSLFPEYTPTSHNLFNN